LHTLGSVRRVVLSLLMLAVLLPSAAFARTEYLCRMDGRIRSSCCCAGKTKPRTDDSNRSTTIRGAACCDVSTVAPTRTVAIHQADSVWSPPELVATAIDPAWPVASTALAPVELRALEPPPPKPDLFARHCALLL